MLSATRRLRSAATLLPIALLASACSSSDGESTDTTQIVEDADLSDGSLASDRLADALAGDWQDIEGGGSTGDLSQVVGTWFSTTSASGTLIVTEEGVANLTTDTGSCYGSASGSDTSYALDFTDCTYPFASASATLSGGLLSVSWEDGTVEEYSQDAPDFDEGGGSATNVGEEISGVWSGNDGSLVAVIPSQESGTGIAAVSYVAAGSESECLGILLEDLLGEGWDATVNCDPESNELQFADITLNGEVMTVAWPDTGESADYQWFSEWDTGLGSGGGSAGSGAGA